MRVRRRLTIGLAGAAVDVARWLDRTHASMLWRRREPLLRDTHAPSDLAARDRVAVAATSASLSARSRLVKPRRMRSATARTPIVRPRSLALAGHALGCLLHREARASQLMQRRLEASEHRGHGPGGARIRGKPADRGSSLHEIAAAVVELVVRRPP